MARKLLTGGPIATMESSGIPYGLIENGAVALEDGLIRWIGSREDLPETWRSVRPQDLEGRLVTPSLIDCHTHLVYGGDRAKEFEQRLTGVSYEEIAKSGGGILSTVNATRSLSAEELADVAEPRLQTLMDEGVTTVEIKSGYGLTIESELAMLEAARILARRLDVRISTTYLAAHAIPPEYAGQGDKYIAEVVIPGLKSAHGKGLVDAVDGFCEGIAFSTEQIRQVFEVAQSLGLPVKLHAEQLSNLGGAKLAASFGALSVEHLEHLDQSGVDALADAGTVAVLLPGAYYTLRETQAPPIEALRAAGVPMAVATDANPGSSPLTSLLLAMNMACTLFRLTPEESLAGATREAARALGLQHMIGTLKVGHRSELAIWDVAHPAELSYRMGFNPLSALLVDPLIERRVGFGG